MKSTIDFKKILRSQYVLILVSVSLGFLFDYLFYDKYLGVSFPLFFVLITVVLILYVLKPPLRRRRFHWFLLIAAIALSCTFVLYTNPYLLSLNLVLTYILLLLGTQLMGSNIHYSLRNHRLISDILGFIKDTIIHMFTPFRLLLYRNIISKSPNNKRITIKLLTGLALSLPVLLIIIPLLSSADLTFLKIVDRIALWISEIDLGDFGLHGFIILSASLIIFSYTYTLSKSDTNESQADTSNTTRFTRLSFDPITTSTMLFVLNAVYIIFTITQFTYLFGGNNDTLISGYTYSEYARKGFFELIAVSIINLGLTLLITPFIKRESRSLLRITQGLLMLLVISTIVILYSAHIRLSLYEETYGYTYMRILPHTFMILVVALLSISSVKIFRKSLPTAKLYAVASIAWYIFFNFMNIDRMITDNNVKRYIRTGKIDISYLTNLSYEAIPSLIRLKKHCDQLIGEEKRKISYGYIIPLGTVRYLEASYHESPHRRRIEISKQLDSYFREQLKDLNIQNDWPAFNFSKYRTRRELLKYMPLLDS